LHDALPIFHSIIKDPQSVGYIVLFLTVPVLLFVGISSTVVILSFFALKQTFAKNGTQILMWHMIVGSVQLALVPIYFYVINYFLGMTLSRSEEHTSELQSRFDLVCRLLLEKKNFCIIKNKVCLFIDFRREINKRMTIESTKT